MGTEKKKATKSARRTTWRGIIGGDILAPQIFRRQGKLLGLLLVLVLFYIHNPRLL